MAIGHPARIALPFGTLLAVSVMQSPFTVKGGPVVDTAAPNSV